MPWRWRVADILGKTPWFCWSDLVSWVMCVEPRERREDYTLRRAFSGRACKQESPESGTFYCGKFQDRPQMRAANAPIDADTEPRNPTVADPWANDEMKEAS